MKGIVGGLLLLILLILPIGARADGENEIEELIGEMDTGAIQQIADEADVELDVMSMIRMLAHGEVELNTEEILALAKAQVLDESAGLPALLLSLIAPMVVWAVLRQISVDGYEGVAACAGYVCYLAAATALIGLFTQQVAGTRAAILTVTRLTDQLIPVLTALLAATGTSATAALFTPAAAMAGGMISTVVRGLVITLSMCAAALVVAGNISPRIRLKGLSDLIISGCNWTMGILMTAFLGIMTVQGILTAGYDGVSIRTARFTVDNLLPIVGGEVADTMDMMVTSATLVKNAAGVTGLILLILFCAKPLIQLLLAILAVKLSAAIVEPIAEGPIERLVGQFSGVLSMLLVALVTCMVIFIVLIGAVITSGRSLMP